jgi:DNA mismatch endonuclease (patch repair protein)
MTVLTVPEAGLDRILADWSGVGALYRTLAALAPGEGIERDWKPQDIERRAMRILLLECAPHLRRWPRTTRIWRDQLPVLSRRTKYWSGRPEPKVNWPRTQARGWPPAEFAIRRRNRSSDQIPLAVLGWTLTELSHATDRARPLLGSRDEFAELLDVEATVRLEAALPLLDVLDEGAPTPSLDDLSAVRGMGWPWSAVSAVASVLSTVYRRDGVSALARRLLRPDGFPDRLFQLAVLGAVIRYFEGRGGRVIGVRPIAMLTDGPVYQIIEQHGETWDLWCEAERCWETYVATDEHRVLARGMRNLTGTPYLARFLRPDILIAQRGKRALVLECKYPAETADPGYVTTGIYQAHFYATQLMPAFDTVDAAVVGPDELIDAAVRRRIGNVDVSVASPGTLPQTLSHLVAAKVEVEVSTLVPDARRMAKIGPSAGRPHSARRTPAADASSSYAGSPGIRRRMQQQRTRDTAPELAVRRLLHARGLRYRVDSPPLNGVRRRADIVFGPSKVAVFIDGCFWHGCPTHGRAQTSVNPRYWSEKIARNKRRDEDTDELLKIAGWEVVRVWEHDPPDAVANRVAVAVATRLAQNETRPPRLTHPSRT